MKVSINNLIPRRRASVNKTQALTLPNICYSRVNLLNTQSHGFLTTCIRPIMQIHICQNSPSLRYKISGDNFCSGVDLDQ